MNFLLGKIIPFLLCKKSMESYPNKGRSTKGRFIDKRDGRSYLATAIHTQ